jgi:hypothetical protein
VGEGAGGGQRVPTLSTGRAGARQRIVHMSTACGFAYGRGCALGVGALWPVAACFGARSAGVGGTGGDFA